MVVVGVLGSDDDGDKTKKKKKKNKAELVAPPRGLSISDSDIEKAAGALAAIDARVEDHWDRAWGASDSLPSLVRRRACIDKIDAVLAQYDTPERFATLDVNDLVSAFGFDGTQRQALREYREKTDAPPVLKAVEETQLERVTGEEWDAHMPLILAHRLGQPACRAMVKRQFDQLELALPRKKGRDAGLLSTLLGLD